MKICVTGAMGYVGGSLCELLHREGHQVVAIDSLIYNQESTLLNCLKYIHEFHKVDVRDHDRVNKIVEKCDGVIPLAALVGAPICDRNPKTATEVNLDAIRNLVNNLSKRQFVLIPNTNSSYGQYDGICTEETPFNPISLYGRVKCEAEDVVMSHGNSTALRLATVYGLSSRMRLDLLVNNFCYRAFFDKKIGIFEGKFRRNFVHVMDVARGFVHCLNNESTRNNIYNLGLDSANMTKRSLAEKIASYIPCEVTEEDGKDSDQRDYWVSSEKLYKTGFVPKFDLDFGIKELIKLFQVLEKSDNKTALMQSMKNPSDRDFL